MEATTFGETSVEIVPCATKKIAKSCMDFRKEELSLLDSFQDYGDIEYLNIEHFYVEDLLPFVNGLQEWLEKKGNLEE